MTVEIFDNGTVEVEPNRSYTLNPDLSDEDLEGSSPAARKVVEILRKLGGTASHADLLAAHPNDR